jgi:hypothetical protein
LLIWDLMSGLRGLNHAGKQVATDRFGESNGHWSFRLPGCGTADWKKRDAVTVFLSNAHRFWNEPDVVQAIWNVRDPFKAGGQCLVMLCSPGATLPPELESDVMVVDEPLPSADELATLTTRLYEEAGLGATLRG